MPQPLAAVAPRCLSCGRLLIAAPFVAAIFIAPIFGRLILSLAFVPLLLAFVASFLAALLIASLAPLLMRVLRVRRQHKQYDACNRQPCNVSEPTHLSPALPPRLPRFGLKTLWIRRHITLDLQVVQFIEVRIQVVVLLEYLQIANCCSWLRLYSCLRGRLLHSAATLI